MRRQIIFFTFILTLVTGHSSIAADYEKGVEALKVWDYATAIEEWSALAEQGHPGAQRELGLLYRQGRGVEKDPKLAVNWITLSAEAGDSRSQLILGGLYMSGDELPLDGEKAIKWLTLAAEQGERRAPMALSLLYGFGHAVKRNELYSQMWWEIARLHGAKVNEIFDTKNTKDMQPSHLKEARDLASEWLKKHVK